MPNSNVLLSTCWTSAGDAVPLPDRDYSPIPLITRIESAAKAGFGGFGILHTDLERYLETGSIPELKLALADNGMTFIEIEFLNHWWTDGELRKESDALRRHLMSVAESLNAHHIKVAPDLDSKDLDIDKWAAEFHQLGVDAENHGTTIALEFMPFSNLYNVELAAEMALKADHPAAGLMIDYWHLERAGTSVESLLNIPLKVIKGVELDDGSASQVGDGYSDTINNRKMCGAGDFKVLEWTRALYQMGWRGPWGVEIISEELRKMSISDALQQVFQTTLKQFELAKLPIPTR